MCDDPIFFVQKQFFSTVSLKNFDWKTVLDHCCDANTSEKSQHRLLLATVGHSENKLYPVRVQYQAAFLKHVISVIEASGTEIQADIYEEYFRVVAEPKTECAFLHFFEEPSRSLVRIKESNSVISNGTTGLSTWPAARVLAEFCAKNRQLFIGKTVLELGCGTGLVGLVVLKTCQPKKYIFSDCNDSVLKLAEDNAQNNCLKNYQILNLPWEEADSDIVSGISPDVILGADVIYDVAVIPALISVLRLSCVKQSVRVIIACAVRNSETFAAFVDCAKKSGAELRDLDLPESDIFFAATDVPLRLFEVRWLESLGGADLPGRYPLLFTEPLGFLWAIDKQDKAQGTPKNVAHLESITTVGDSVMTERRGMKALELWCRRVTDGYPGVKIENMTTSWRDGLAFCALIHHFRPDLIDFDRLDKRDILKNNELAFRVAERQLGIPALLDAEDMVEYEIPDRLSILTYLSQFYQAFAHQGGNSPTVNKHNSSVQEMLDSSSPGSAVKVGRGRVERCSACDRPVFLAERLVIGSKLRHRSCFVCARCGHQLNPVSCYETETGDFVCDMCPDEDAKRAEEPAVGLESGEIVPGPPVEKDPDDEPPVELELTTKPTDPSKAQFLSDILDGNKTDLNITSSPLCDDVNLEESEVLNPVEEPSENNEEVEEKVEEISEILDEVSISEEKITDASINNENDTKITISEPPSPANPFEESDEEEAVANEAIPVPLARTCRKVEVNDEGKTILEAPKYLNPFWSESDLSDEEPERPVPAPRLLKTPEPIPRSRFGSSTSLTSQSSSSAGRRKKRPAPQPPGEFSSPVSTASSPTPTRRRKSRPAPPPPINFDKDRKDYENKVKQNLSPPDKSTYGKWKRKKGAAPGLPIPPQRRRIIPLPVGDLGQEVEDLEIQQRELERQGVKLEQNIRNIEEGIDEDQSSEKDIEEMVLQLFEIVNKKNELFRRQAELMFLRKQQRLEEEHADIEYQIRCLMGKPKNEADPALEEELIRRLVDVVERRNEIIDCLDMNRKRAVEEDQSIQDRLQAYSNRDLMENQVDEPVVAKKKSAKSVLKLIKKKKEKKKEKDESDKRKDLDVDLDESVTEDVASKSSTLRIKKKWFKLEK